MTETSSINSTDQHDHDDHDDFGGLHRDLPHFVGRRRALQLLGGAGMVGLLAACGSSSESAGTAGSSSTTASTPGSTAAAGATSTTGSVGTGSSTTTGSAVAASAGEEIPDETAGPYPADGSNGPNVLGESDVVRSDLTTSFAGLSGTAAGVPVTFDFTVVDADTGSPLPGAAFYLWHCTADGQYSLYEISDQNYLRGVQSANDAGRVTFTSIFPGCYRGRWPHCHFEVYESLDRATAGSQAIKTSQLALPQADCETIYSGSSTASDYGNSASNLAQLSLQTDGIFRDGWTDQLGTVTGTADGGLTVSLLVRV